eukprot:1145774-Pelagomonas_calceolata.AAC.1
MALSIVCILCSCATDNVGYVRMYAWLYGSASSFRGLMNETGVPGFPTMNKASSFRSSAASPIHAAAAAAASAARPAIQHLLRLPHHQTAARATAEGATAAAAREAPVTPTKRKRISQESNPVQHQHCPPPAAGAAAP